MKYSTTFFGALMLLFSIVCMDSTCCGFDTTIVYPIPTPMQAEMAVAESTYTSCLNMGQVFG